MDNNTLHRAAVLNAREGANMDNPTPASKSSLPRPASRTQRTVTVKSLLGGKVRLLRHNNNPMLYARASFQGGYVTLRTLETTIRAASQVAEDWYLDLRARARRGEQLHEPLFAALVQEFLSDPSVKASVSTGTHENYAKKWRVLEPLLTAVRVSQLTLERLEEIRTTRAAAVTRYGTPITANTLDKDITFLRQVLRWGRDRKHLTIVVPPAPSRMGRFAVVKHGRPSLALRDWRRVTRAAHTRAIQAEHRRAQQEQTPTRGRKVDPEKAWELYYFLLIACGGALRTGEAYSLRWQDCEDTVLTTPEGQEAPAIRVRVLGKHSRGGQREDGWVLFGGHTAFHALRARREADPPEASLFRYDHEVGCRALLQSLNLYTDPQSGLTRNTKSLRVTGINLRLLKNPSVSLNDVRKWARTSILQIQQFYDQLHPETSAARVAGGSTARRVDPLT